MTAKSEREKRREERLAAEQAQAAADRRRLLLGYAVAGALTLAVVVGLFIVLTSGGDSEPQVGGEDIPEGAHIQVQSGYVHNVTPDGRTGTPPPPLAQGDLEAAAREAGCELELDLREEGSNHITKENEIPDYETNPPTSGNHNPEQQADGAYSEMPEPWWFIHSLEHGRIEIQYSPDLPEEDQLALKGVFDEAPDGILLFPNDEMPHEIAVTAWTQMMTCDSYEGAATLDAIRDFRDIYIGQGPEDVPLALAE
jgi:8-oxo-dGTP pyrophosphatase MutT (NUDIX family)